MNIAPRQTKYGGAGGKVETCFERTNLFHLVSSNAMAWRRRAGIVNECGFTSRKCVWQLPSNSSSSSDNEMFTIHTIYYAVHRRPRYNPTTFWVWRGFGSDSKIRSKLDSFGGEFLMTGCLLCTYMPPPRLCLLGKCI